jgi:hypothetical protein
MIGELLEILRVAQVQEEIKTPDKALKYLEQVIKSDSKQ